MEPISILSIISEYGTSAIIAIIIIYLLWVTLTGLVSAKFKSFFSGENKIEKVKKNELKFHSFFTNAEYRLVAEIPSLEILPDKPVKEQMFKDLIMLQTKVIYESCRDIIDVEFDDWSSDQWQNEISKKITEMISTIYMRAKAEGIPEIVIAKYNRWNIASFEMLYEYVKILGTSTTYSDNITRTNTLLLIMNLMLVTIVADAEKSLKELNGEVAGKTYKNMILED